MNDAGRPLPPLAVGGRIDRVRAGLGDLCVDGVLVTKLVNIRFNAVLDNMVEMGKLDPEKRKTMTLPPPIKPKPMMAIFESARLNIHPQCGLDKFLAKERLGTTRPPVKIKKETHL